MLAAPCVPVRGLFTFIQLSFFCLASAGCAFPGSRRFFVFRCAFPTARRIGAWLSILLQMLLVVKCEL